MIHDAFRSLRAAPRATAFILFVLTLTIAAATVTFSVVDAVVLRPLPFARLAGLVQIAHDRGDRLMPQARAAGVYGVMSSVVAQRTREIGVRLALGATPRRIVSVVLSQLARIIAAGLAVGLPLAWAVSRGFAAQFFEVRPTDAWVYLIVAGAIGVAALLAVLLPARRASRVDPLLALRSE